MKGTRPVTSSLKSKSNYEGHPAPTGPALTNDLCGQNVKVKVKTSAVLADAEIKKLILTF